MTQPRKHRPHLVIDTIQNPAGVDPAPSGVLGRVRVGACLFIHPGEI